MEEKYWQKLLREWRNSGHDGFSIPYLIGSQQFLPEKSPVQSIEDLLTDIIDTCNEPILLRYCFHIGDLILELTASHGYTHFPSFRQKAQSTLSVSDFVDDLGDSVEEMVNILTDRYEHHIIAGNYSINDGKRTDFTPDEKAFIRKCFENNFPEQH